MIYVTGNNKMFLVRYLCPILTKFGFFRHIFIKVPSTKFYGKMSNGRYCDTRGRIGVYDKTNRRFSILCKNA